MSVPKFLPNVAILRPLKVRLSQNEYMESLIFQFWKKKQFLSTILIRFTVSIVWYLASVSWYNSCNSSCSMVNVSHFSTSADNLDNSEVKEDFTLSNLASSIWSWTFSPWKKKIKHFSLKFIYSGKTTTIWRNLQLLFEITKFYLQLVYSKLSVLSKWPNYGWAKHYRFYEGRKEGSQLFW